MKDVELERPYSPPLSPFVLKYSPSLFRAHLVAGMGIPGQQKTPRGILARTRDPLPPWKSCFPFGYGEKWKGKEWNWNTDHYSLQLVPFFHRAAGFISHCTII
jgi:hypothetical protein